jgi:3-deoxy-7-phosphoheptulonate synthase
VAAACQEIEAAKLPCQLMIDASHANSSKQHQRQIEVMRTWPQLAAGNRCIFGVMVESHLNAARRSSPRARTILPKLEYGKSITDACIGWEDTAEVLHILSAAVKARRRHGA